MWTKMVRWSESKIKQTIAEVQEYYAAAHGGLKRKMLHYDRIRVWKHGQLQFVRKAEEEDDNPLVIAPYIEYHKILTRLHKDTLHRGRDHMRQSLKETFYIPKWAVKVFLKCCPYCQSKKKFEKASLVVEHILSNHNSMIVVRLILSTSKASPTEPTNSYSITRTT